MPSRALIIVGGGLAGGLCALALAKSRPDVVVTLVEAEAAIGGNHLWSFFDSDLSEPGRTLVGSLIGHRWPGYEVRFPLYQRRLGAGYNSIESEALDQAVRGAMASGAIVRANAAALTPTSITLDDGRTLTADAVLDARGLSAAPEGLHCGWQKFVGQLLDISQGHGLAEPIVMDATVDQADGFRFVYCLPFSPTALFVEDTYYTDEPDLDRERLRERIADYGAGRGWQIAGRTREEHGVLPVVIGGDFDRFWPAADTVARAGVRGGFFHSLTSYSLPEAVRFAVWLASDAPLDGQLGPATRARAVAHWRRSKFDRLLTRMLMRAADPLQRYKVLQRFYRLPAQLIERFYAGRSTLGDRMRILTGRPPVNFFRALAVLPESK